MRPYRLALVLALSAALAPGTWLRSELPRVGHSPLTTLTPLKVDPVRSGPFVLAGAWHITADNYEFGGLSALTALPGDRLLAGSDAGGKLVFTRPDRAGPPALFSRFGADANSDKMDVDLESLTRDPAGSHIWAGYEGSNAIRRFGPDLQPQGSIVPPQMADWGDNSGPEALARLADGRFLAIEERALDWDTALHRAVLFAGDPLEQPVGIALRIAVPEGYRPVDLVDAGDGRLLVLLRQLVFALPPGFDSAVGELAVADLRHGAEARVRIIARLGEGFPHDNYEGLALTADGPGRRALWIVSDDNKMHYQRTLLLKLRWQERQKARE